MSSVGTVESLPQEIAPALPSRFEQRGNVIQFLPQAIVNAALVIASFNLYLFWAKTHTRRYIWSTTWLGSMPLRYTGKGRELAMGFASSAAVLLIAFGLPLASLITELNLWFARTGMLDTLRDGTGNALVDLLLLLVLPVSITLLALLVDMTPTVDLPAPQVALCGAIVIVGWFYALSVSRHLAFRYLLRHTAWQNIRGEIAGSPWRYGGQLLLPELSRWLTLGWTGPWRYLRRWERLLNGARFGTGRIAFRASARELYPHFAAAWALLAILAFGLTMLGERLRDTPDAADILTGWLAVACAIALVAVAHYNQRAYRCVASAIRVGDLRFRFAGTRRSLIKLYLTNLVMNLFSTGLAYYYTRLRIARYFAANIVIEGDPHSLLSADDSQETRRERFGEGLETLVAASYV